ncbi:MAG: hypothetical protein ACKV2V_26210 [Blastocatellia bacterium]
MASFRIRKPAEYLKMLWRRRYYVLVPFLLVSATLLYSIKQLPDMYESRSLIIVDPPKVSEGVAPQTVNVDISARLSTIRQAVTSRSNLELLINKYDLYKVMRAQKTPMEGVVETMRDHIDVEIRNMGSGYNAFTIAFRDNNKEVVQAVCSELAAQFSDENMRRSRELAGNTLSHLDNELKNVKEQLDKIVSLRTKYIVDHPTVMPGQMQSIVGEMTSLSQQMLAQQTQLGSLQSTVANYQQMLQLAQTQETEQPVVNSDQFSMAEGQLRTKRAEVTSTLENLKQVYTDKHPDVRAVQTQLEKINKELDDLDKKSQEKRDRVMAQKKKNSTVDQVQLNIDSAKRELARRQGELEKMNAEYASLQAQLRSIPPLTAEMERIERDYGTLNKRHDEMLTRRQNADLGKRLIDDFNGETFKIQDPANLPEAPVSPQRSVLYPLSLILGLLSGLAVALAVEARFLFTVRDARDVEHYTRLPLLVTVPEILTESEEQRRRVLALATAVAVVVFLVVSVPVLVKVLQFTRVLDMFTGAY